MNVCPLCQTELKNYGEVSNCPKNHGLLVTGKKLRNVFKKAEHHMTAVIDAGSNTSHIIVCPHCSSNMEKTDYNHTGIIIDSCPKCHYRWLDHGELKKIHDYKPPANPDVLLAKVNLEYELAQRQKQGAADLPAPFYGSSLGGLVRGGFSGDSRRTMGFLMTVGLYGLITGMIKSKFMRIIGPIFIIVLGYLGYRLLKVAQEIAAGS